MDQLVKKEIKEEIGLDMRAGKARRRRIMPESIDKNNKPISSSTPRRRGSLGWHKITPKEDVADTVSPALRAARAVSMMPKSKPEKESVPYTKIRRPAPPRATRATRNEKRPCIVKVDSRHSSKRGSKSLLSARLAPFMKQSGSATGARVGYIRREDAIDGMLFGTVGNEFVFYSGDEAIKNFGAGETETIIISPEDKGADLLELTRSFMRDIYPMHSDAMPRFWCAAIHGNTAHRHVHIITSTLGSDNKTNATLDYGYVHSGRLQSDVSTLLTLQQGYRTWYEINEAKRRKRMKLLSQSIDDDMLKNAKEQENGTKVFTLNSLESQVKKDKASRRLQVLKKAGFVTNGASKGEWIFSADAEEKLKRLDYVDAFGFTEKDFDNLIIDTYRTPPYTGTIIETAVKGGDDMWDNRIENNKSEITKAGKVKETKGMMLFLIKDDDGKLHLRREFINGVQDKKKKEAMTSVSAKGFKKGLEELLVNSRSK